MQISSSKNQAISRNTRQPKPEKSGEAISQRIGDAVEVGLDSTASALGGLGAAVPILGVGVHITNYNVSDKRNDEQGQMLAVLGGITSVAAIPLGFFAPEAATFATVGSAALGATTTYRNIRRGRREQIGSSNATTAERLVETAGLAVGGATMGAIPGIGLISGLSSGLAHINGKSRDVIGGMAGLGAAIANGTSVAALLLGAESVATTAAGVSALCGAVSWARLDATN